MSLVLGSVAIAQSGSIGTQQTPSFAPPWGIQFRHIQAAMEGRAGAGISTYSIEQKRHEIDPVSSKWVTTREHLLFRPADQSPARFKLEFRGIEGRKLTSAEFARLATLFEGKAGFTFRYKGFRVADPALAAKTYDLVFLTQTTRATREGNLPVYRVAVVPKNWDRAGWILELEVRTGYPLYVGEYALLKAGGIALRSELRVTSFKTNVRVPQANDKSWWRTTKGIAKTSKALDAAKKAFPNHTAHVVPALTDLPGGFALEASEVHTHPLTGEKIVVLKYTDGLDQMFVTERGIKRVARDRSDTISFLESDGVTRFLFSHLGVQFEVVGRNSRDEVRAASVRVFSRAIRVLK